MRRTALAPIIVLAFAVQACEEKEREGGPLMRPGEACLGCHSAGSGSEASEHPFTAAGTVFVDASGSAGAGGVTVVVTDSSAREVTMMTNEAGNFFTGEALDLPLSIRLTDGTDEVQMVSAAPTGDCNSCHGSTMHFP